MLAFTVCAPLLLAVIGSLGSRVKVGASTQVKYICNATGEECSACRYHCTRMPDVDLSPAAYADGKFPPGCSSKDFVRIDQAELQVCNSKTLLALQIGLHYCAQ